mmetsp:Transcript_1342/g.3045  ORF Transcript_1342/g.3045 Transcript_1342/m.3045 type:complete len:354 (-) Transcript_1342:155-1216(-)
MNLSGGQYCASPGASFQSYPICGYAPITAAAPKSISSIWWLATMMFEGLMSLCAMPAFWSSAQPTRSCVAASLMTWRVSLTSTPSPRANGSKLPASAHACRISSRVATAPTCSHSTQHSPCCSTAPRNGATTAGQREAQRSLMADSTRRKPGAVSYTMSAHATSFCHACWACMAVVPTRSEPGGGSCCPNRFALARFATARVPFLGPFTTTASKTSPKVPPPRCFPRSTHTWSSANSSDVRLVASVAVIEPKPYGPLSTRKAKKVSFGPLSGSCDGGSCCMETGRPCNLVCKCFLANVPSLPLRKLRNCCVPCALCTWPAGSARLKQEPGRTCQRHRPASSRIGKRMLRWRKA